MCDSIFSPTEIHAPLSILGIEDGLLPYVEKLVASRNSTAYTKLATFVKNCDFLAKICIQSYILMDIRHISCGKHSNSIACIYFLDHVGNYLIQEMMEASSEAQLYNFYYFMRPNLRTLCTHSHGSFVVQKLIHLAPSLVNEAMMEELLPIFKYLAKVLITCHLNMMQLEGSIWIFSS